MPRPKKSNRADGRYEIKRVIGHTYDGKPLQRSFYGHNKAEAEEAYSRYLLQVDKEEKKKKATPFSEWVTTWLETYKKPDVRELTFITTYERPCRVYILPAFGDRTVQDISNADIKGLLSRVAADRSQSIVNKVYLCLQGLFEAAIDNDLIDKNPCRNITAKSKVKKKEKRVYDRDSAELLCASGHRYTLIVRLMLQMGLRASEVCGLRWQDVNFSAGTLTVNQSITYCDGITQVADPKSINAHRTLPVPPELLSLIKEAKKNAPGGELGKYVTSYEDINGKRMHLTAYNIRKVVLKRFYNDLGVPEEQRLNPHELRHTCGTLLYESTKDIYHVSRFLGHADIGITSKTYVHSDFTEKKVHITQKTSSNPRQKTCEPA